MAKGVKRGVSLVEEVTLSIVLLARQVVPGLRYGGSCELLAYIANASTGFYLHE
jgi:hypothetical protein